MPTSYLPARDADYLVWLTNYVAYVVANAAVLGLTNAQVIAAQGALEDFQQSLNEATTAKAAAVSAVETKDASRASSEVLIRAQVREIQAHPTVPDAMRASLKITVPDQSRTPGAAPVERADVRVDVVGQEHRVTVLDGTNNRARRPAAARFVELYRAVVAAGQPLPTSVDQMALVGAFTASRFTVLYPGGDIGKTVAYIARYVGAKNQPGPVGSLATATIAA